MSVVPPDPAAELVLELVRSNARSISCPGCRHPLQNCRLELREVVPDRIVVDVTCSRCGRWASVTVCPDTREGTATTR